MFSWNVETVSRVVRKLLNVKKSVATVCVGFVIRLLWRVSGVGVPFLPLLVVVLVVLVP